MQKILIIDNDVSHLAKLGNLITEVREKSEVYQTANGQNALWTAVEKQPDLIMLSWNITDMNCLELIHKFKSNITTQNTPIIILTEEYVSLSEIEDALQAGAIDYLRKPIDQMELLARVNSGLKLSRLYQAIKRSEQALQRQRAQLDELLREQNHLLAIVSHDLRSPLNKALGLMQFLPYDGVLNEAQKMSINMIEKVLEGGRKLIDDILIINAKEADVGIIETQKIDMVAWLQNIVNTFKPHADHKNIMLHLTTPPECVIHSNEENLGRIIDNLLSNAIKFSYPQKNVYIALENPVGAERVELSVKDEGQGMSEQDQQLMFKKFQKLSAKPTGNEHSTGLGLSIIKTLVTQLHGDIRVKSELGKGTTFTISLPTAPLN